jgi:hypothetical protein
MSPRKKVVLEEPVPDDIELQTLELKTEADAPRPDRDGGAYIRDDVTGVVTRTEGPSRDCGFVADEVTGKRLPADLSGKARKELSDG